MTYRVERKSSCRTISSTVTVPGVTSVSFVWTDAPPMPHVDARGDQYCTAVKRVAAKALN
jgi:hypothetical protein